MLYRVLGKTEIKVSVIGVGTWQFGGEWGKTFTQKEVDRILGTAGDEGMNLIDTAECYGDHSSEAFIGKSIAKKRGDWIVATKFGHKFHGFTERSRHFDADEVRKQLEDSLRALRTDYIDLYQFHSGTDEEFANDALWTMLDKQIDAGKIRHIGLSIKKNSNLFQTESAPSVGAETIQLVYNRLDRQPEEDVLPACRRLNLGVLARVPLASGFLAGKYAPGTVFPENDVRSGRGATETLRRLEEVEQIKNTELPAKTKMASWALAWCLAHPAVTCVIPGCKDERQVRDNARAVRLVEHPQHHPLAAQAGRKSP